jgi:hypothetical protein
MNRLNTLSTLPQMCIPSRPGFTTRFHPRIINEHPAIGPIGRVGATHRARTVQYPPRLSLPQNRSAATRARRNKPGDFYDRKTSTPALYYSQVRGNATQSHFPENDPPARIKTTSADNPKIRLRSRDQITPSLQTSGRNSPMIWKPGKPAHEFAPAPGGRISRQSPRISSRWPAPASLLSCHP